MEPISHQLLDALPCGAVLLRGGVPEVCNRAALRLFPELSQGRLPEELEELLAAWPDGTAGAGSCAAGGREYRVSLSREEAGVRLLSLMAQETRPPVPMERLSGQLRQYLGELRLAVDALAAQLKESGQGEEAFSVLNQNFYRLLRMSRHMELAEDLKREVLLPEALDLVDLCAGLVDETDLLAGQAGVRLHYDSKLITLPTTGSRELLRIMLLNLLSNAVKAAGRGGAVELGLAKAPGRAVVTVVDNGKEAVDLTGLFQSGEAERKPGGGLGLGLTLARQIALLHEGLILVVRSGGETRVTVSLPLERLEAPDSLHTPVRDAGGGFSDALVELADALPACVFDFTETE